MNTTNILITTGIVIGAGMLASEKHISGKIMVGSAASALGVAIIANANPQIGQGFALLILFTAMTVYMPTIAKAITGATK